MLMLLCVTRSIYTTTNASGHQLFFLPLIFTMAAPPPTAGSGLPAPSSPPRRTLQGSFRHSSEITLAEDLYPLYAEEMQGYWLGPANPTTFLKSFMPLPIGKKLPQKDLRASFKKMPVNPSHESEMYAPFVSRLYADAAVRRGRSPVSVAQ